MTTVIARTVTRLVVPIILVTAIALLLQGHNLPGGGFIAGVLATTAFVLVYVIQGLEYLRTGLGMSSSADSPFGHAPIAAYRTILAAGLLLAFGSGLVPILFGKAFLTQGYTILHDVPLYGELEVASALAFDLGVFLIVVGGLLSIVAVVGTE
ncbi:MAG: MnhB domain-containing protein [Halobacteriales archaeon]